MLDHSNVDQVFSKSKKAALTLLPRYSAAVTRFPNSSNFQPTATPLPDYARPLCGTDTLSIEFCNDSRTQTTSNLTRQFCHFISIPSQPFFCLVRRRTVLASAFANVLLQQNAPSARQQAFPQQSLHSGSYETDASRPTSNNTLESWTFCSPSGSVISPTASLDSSHPQV